MSEVLWYYEEGGKQAGPISQAAMAEAIQGRRLPAGSRVWRAGMAGWLAWEALPELAALAPPPPAGSPPPLSAPPPAAPGWGPPPVAPQPGWSGPAGAVTPGSGPTAFEPVSIAAVILLSVVTIGIYGMVKFYQTGVGYEQAAQRTGRFTTNFWIYVGVLLGVLFLNLTTGFVGYFLAPVAIVFQYLTLNDALKARAEAMQRLGVSVQVYPDSNHRTFLLLGAILSYVLVGVIFTILQTVRWFEDWNVIGRASGGRLR